MFVPLDRASPKSKWSRRSPPRPFSGTATCGAPDAICLVGAADVGNRLREFVTQSSHKGTTFAARASVVVDARASRQQNQCPLSALSPLLLCGGLSANRIPGPAGSCRRPSSRRSRPVAGGRPGSASGRRSHRRGRALPVAESRVVPAPLIGKSAGSGRPIRQVGRWAISSRAES